MTRSETQPGSGITRESMFEPLLAADPAFEGSWQAFREEYRNEPEPPHYILLADLARHLIGQLEVGDTDRFDAVFDVVERWHCEGDAYVREAATIGLLEDLQNQNLHRRTRPADFERWIRPQSAIWWRKVMRFWSDGSPII